MKKILAIVLTVAMLFSLSAMLVAAEETTTELGKFDDPAKLVGFSAKNVKYGFAGYYRDTTPCTVTAQEDGSVHVAVKELDPEAADINAWFLIKYCDLMLNFWTGLPSGLSGQDKLNLIPNNGFAEEESPYHVVVMKVKRNEAIQDQDLYMYYNAGVALSGGMMNFTDATLVWPTTATSSNEGDDYEYFVFDVDEELYPDFAETYINTLAFCFVNDIVYDDTDTSTMTLDLFGMYLYTDMDAAAADLNLTYEETPDIPVEPDESETGDESESTSETESVTETQKQTTKETTSETAATTTKKEESGCGSVVGVSAAAVVLSAVAAAVVLKKKD